MSTNIESPSSALPRIQILSSYSSWTAVSVVGATVLRLAAPQYLLLKSLFWTATVLWITQWLIYSFYAVIVYPNFLSPLRNLPGPPVSIPHGCCSFNIDGLQNESWINGNFFGIVKEPSGMPMRRWASSIPNDGLLHYRYISHSAYSLQP